MESEGLHLNIDYVGSSGIVLSPEQKAALQTSLVILQSENKFKKVYFWGKILGIKDDYFIAQGTGKDEMAERRTFYRYVSFYSSVFLEFILCIGNEIEMDIDGTVQLPRHPVRISYVGLSTFSKTFNHLRTK